MVGEPRDGSVGRVFTPPNHALSRLFGSSERCNAPTEWKRHWTWLGCGFPSFSCAKSLKVHGWVPVRCGFPRVSCAKTAKVHGFAAARRRNTRPNPYTFADLAPAGTIHPHLGATHLCTFAFLAHAAARHPHQRVHSPRSEDAYPALTARIHPCLSLNLVPCALGESVEFHHRRPRLSLALARCTLGESRAF